MTLTKQWQRAGELFGQVSSRIDFGDLTMTMPSHDTIAIRCVFIAENKVYSVERWFTLHEILETTMSFMIDKIVHYFSHEVSKVQSKAAALETRLREAKLGASIDNAAENMPPYWTLSVCIETERIFLRLTDPADNEVRVSQTKDVNEDIKNAVAKARNGNL